MPRLAARRSGTMRRRKPFFAADGGGGVEAALEEDMDDEEEATRLGLGSRRPASTFLAAAKGTKIYQASFPLQRDTSAGHRGSLSLSLSIYI